MKAAVLKKIGSPLVLEEMPIPEPKKGEVLIKVLACGVCRTDLHIFDKELIPPHLPLIMGHQIVGKVESASDHFKKTTLVGIPWLGKSCGSCPYCQKEEENLCDNAEFTGYTINGGFAQYCVADENFIFSLSKEFDPIYAAPLLCAGLIGYRSWKMAKEAKKIGFYGFGSAAHLLIQVALYHKQKVFAFTREGDLTTQRRAKALGAAWAGDSKTQPPELLDAAIIFAPVGPLVPIALKAVRKGGSVICAGIHMSPIPSFSYDILWGERVLRSVSNLTRRDGEEFLALAPKIPIKTIVTSYPLEKINEALDDLRAGKIEGSAVITPW